MADTDKAHDLSITGRATATVDTGSALLADSVRIEAMASLMWSHLAMGCHMDRPIVIHDRDGYIYINDADITARGFSIPIGRLPRPDLWRRAAQVCVDKWNREIVGS